MRITFRTTKLKKQFESGKAARRAYGDDVAKRFVQRILLLQEARNVYEAAELPGLRGHPLKGDRNGQWAIRLNGFYRLVFRLTDDVGEEIEIEEVSKHYDD